MDKTQDAIDHQCRWMDIARQWLTNARDKRHLPQWRIFAREQAKRALAEARRYQAIARG